MGSAICINSTRFWLKHLHLLLFWVYTFTQMDYEGAMRDHQLRKLRQGERGMVSGESPEQGKAFLHETPRFTMAVRYIENPQGPREIEREEETLP